VNVTISRQCVFFCSFFCYGLVGIQIHRTLQVSCRRNVFYHSFCIFQLLDCRSVEFEWHRFYSLLWNYNGTLHLQQLIKVIHFRFSFSTNSDQHHYFNSLRTAQKTSRRIFEVLAFMAETFVFVYLGHAIFTFDQARQLSLCTSGLFNNVFILDSVKS
jgi:hypothetical protein